MILDKIKQARKGLNSPAQESLKGKTYAKA